MVETFDIGLLKKTFGSFATGVCVASSHSSGFTVNSFSSLSLDPPLMIFNIYKTETDHIDFLKLGSFAINFLASDQKDISNLFASKDKDKLSKAPHYKNDNDIAILNDTLGHLELSIYQQIDIADHVLVIGKVENLSINENKEPLIYYRSQYREVK
jgi:flavin reductase (DIM6/NTAB) family NADH-FMN oxidoreductase RutF|tara:strand:+ start:2069 stop:2536 length:468 start_codon:yes stop_codon:yes gene_type:complete